MSDAADRVMRALADHEVIAVFGDFDVDGMSSTCLLTLALRRLGAEVHPFIPNRFGEGYGLSREALRPREAGLRARYSSSPWTTASPPARRWRGSSPRASMSW